MLFRSVLFVVLVGFLAVGLKLDPREVPSPFIGKPAPAFSAPLLGQDGHTVKREDMLGKVWVLNVWASWCQPCRDEHPVMVALARKGLVPIYGLNYKDQLPAAQGWLQRYGNPYTESLVDADGRIGIDWGVYGVPETFVIDKGGVVRMKHVGPVTPEVVADQIEPLVRKLNG